jgi:hypothetical protein
LAQCQGGTVIALSKVIFWNAGQACLARLPCIPKNKRGK